MKEEGIILRPDFESIEPSPEEVCAIMGYKPEAIPSFIPEMLHELLKAARRHTDAAGCFRWFGINEMDIRSGKILIQHGEIKCGNKIALQLSGAETVVLFIATAGNSFDDWIKKNGSDGDIMAEYISGAIGSVIADKVADAIQREVAVYAMSGNKGITNRYSPGYCSWNVREQKLIFDLLPAAETGVILNSSFLMKPIKSVSGIIGVGPGLKPGEYICDICDKKNCLVKRAKEKKGL